MASALKFGYYSAQKELLKKELSVSVWPELPTDKELAISAYRKQFTTSRKTFAKTDLGTGNNRIASVSKVAKSSSISRINGQFLYALVRAFQPKSILELGTCLGVSTQYLFHGNKLAKITSVEGCPGTFGVRQGLSSQDSEQQIQFLNQSFIDFFNSVETQFDFVFLDGHHDGKATLQYFELLKPLLLNHTIIVFDDIHWSADMFNAWKQLKQAQGFRSFELFQFGILVKM
ncbi:MAG: class I SAM-dependent methyltransferase [Bacteroidetes bacterium]|nr:class I SAM-dependent methyltransferase [Bacteroidota bacterium]